MEAVPFQTEDERRDGSDGRKRRKITLHSGQGKVMRTPARFKVVTCGRRWGKSDLGATWTWAQVGDSVSRHKRGLIWVVAPTYYHLRTNWSKILSLAPRGWVQATIGTAFHPDSIVCASGVTIQFRSAHKPESLVGEGLLGLWVDECGIIKGQTWEESLSPTLIDHAAPALLTGTPKGRNWFYEQAIKGISSDPRYADYEFFTGPSYENPFIQAEEIDRYCQGKPRRTVLQEILAEFITGEGSVFGDVRQCTKRTNGLYSSRPTVALGIDLGRKLDYTVVIGIDAEGDVTFFQRFNEIDWPVQRAKIKAIWLSLGQPGIVIDSTGAGDPFAQDLALEVGYQIDPFVFTGKSKMTLVENLIVGIEHRAVGLPDEAEIINELEIFEHKVLPSGHTRYTAPEGRHDDVVMALALAWRGMERYSDIGITV